MHTEDLDSVVRDEIRRTLIEELAMLSAETKRAIHSLQRAGRRPAARAAFWGILMALIATGIPVAIMRWALPSESQIAALRWRRDELAASVARLERRGGRVEWRRCGATARLCIRIDRARRCTAKSRIFTSWPDIEPMDMGVSIYLLRSRWAVLFAAVVMLALCACMGLTRRKSRDTYRRGTLLLDKPALRVRRGRAAFSVPPVTLAGVAIAAADETKHFKLIGTTGTGKSTAIRELLGAALIAAIAQCSPIPTADTWRSFSTDTAANRTQSLRRDSVKWDLFTEIHDSYDVDQLAGGLIPPPMILRQRVARLCAHFLAAVVRRCHIGRRDVAKFMVAADRGIAGRVAADSRRHAGATLSRSRQRPHVRFDPVGRRFGYRSTRVHPGSAGTPFSVREWVRSSLPG